MRFLTILAFFMISLLPFIVFGQESGNAIMEKAHLESYYSGDDSSMMMAMLVYSKGSKKPLNKTFVMLRKDIEEGGRQAFFIFFKKPSDIKKTTFLVQKHIEKDDYRRLYIPASDHRCSGFLV